jgi:ATP-dependent Zn protease
MYTSSQQSSEISYSEFRDKVENGEVDSVVINQTDNTIEITAKAEEGQVAETYYTGVLDDPNLITFLDENDVSYTSEIPKELSPMMSFFISWLLPMGIMFLLLSLLFRNMGSRMGGLGGVGKANAKVYVEKKTGIPFADVAGQDEAKESLMEIHHEGQNIDSELLAARRENDQLKLYIAAVIRLLTIKGILTAEEVKRMVDIIDGEDGAMDGRARNGIL